jgi:hypothetical protein
MSAITMPLHLPFKMRGYQQRGWAAALTTVTGLLAVVPLAMEVRERRDMNLDRSPYQRIHYPLRDDFYPLWDDFYVNLAIAGLVVAAVGIRMSFCSLVVDERGVVITKAYWRYRIAWCDLQGIDIVNGTEVVEEGGLEEDRSRLRFHRGPGRRPIMADTTVRPGWNNAELTELAAQLIVLRERAALTPGPRTTPSIRPPRQTRRRNWERRSSCPQHRPQPASPSFAD